MNMKLAIVVMMCILGLAGCTSKNHTSVILKYDSKNNKLKVSRTESARNLSKLKTKAHRDTLELFVYDKPFFLTFSKEKKKLFEFELIIPDSIRVIKYGINAFSLEELQSLHGEYVYPKKTP